LAGDQDLERFIIWRRSMSTESWEEARKSYLTSLRAKLKSAYRTELESDTAPERRWLNGFMAAGFHSGLLTLRELKLENLSAYRKVSGMRMAEGQEEQLERRLTRLCGP